VIITVIASNSGLLLHTVVWSVCVCVCVCVCLFAVNFCETCKMAEPIEMPSGRLTRVGPMNHVLDGSPDPPREGALLRGSWSHRKPL